MLNNARFSFQFRRNCLLLSRDADMCPIIPFDETQTWTLGLGEKRGAWFTSADASISGQERKITLNGNPLWQV